MEDYGQWQQRNAPTKKFVNRFVTRTKRLTTQGKQPSHTHATHQPPDKGKHKATITRLESTRAPYAHFSREEVPAHHSEMRQLRGGSPGL